MLNKVTKKDIVFLLANIKKREKIGKVPKKIIIYIYNNQVKSFIYYGGKEITTPKNHKQTDITQFIKGYINGEYDLQETVDTIQRYVNDMIKEYNDETVELEFYKRIDKFKCVNQTCCDKLKERKYLKFEDYCYKDKECLECQLHNIQRSNGISCKMLYELLVENQGVINIDINKEKGSETNE